MKLVDRMESGDVLVVTKLDRLGRNAMDVRTTVEQLARSDVRSARLRCTALPDFVFDVTNGAFEKSLDTDHMFAHCATLSGGEHAVHIVAGLELD